MARMSGCQDHQRFRASSRSLRIVSGDSLVMSAPNPESSARRKGTNYIISCFLATPSPPRVVLWSDAESWFCRKTWIGGCSPMDAEPTPAAESSTSEFTRLLEYLKGSRGFDFGAYKVSTLMRRV